MQLLMEIFNKPLLRVLLGFLTIFCSVLFLLNPEFLQVYLHEHTYHKLGSEIEHKHTDYSVHAVFKHFINEPQEVSIHQPGKDLFVHLFLFNLKFVFTKLILIFACLFLFLLTLLIQKRHVPPLTIPCSRSPPVFH